MKDIIRLKERNIITEHEQQTETLHLWKNDMCLLRFTLENSTQATRDLTLSLDYDGKIVQTNIYTLMSTLAYNGPYLGYGDAKRALPLGQREKAYDVLKEKQHICLEKQAQIDFFITFKSGTITGSDEIKLVISEGKEKISESIFNVKILDRELDKSQFSFEMWQYPYSTAEYYQVEPFSKAHFDLIQASMARYKSMGGQTITASILEDPWNKQTYSAQKIHYPAMIKWILEDDQTMTYDYQAFDAWVKFNKDLGLADHIVLYTMAPWHESFTYWSQGELIYEPYDVNDPLYEARWLHFLTDLTQHLMDKGWFEHCYIGIDERGFHPKPFEIIKKVRNIHAESLKTAAAIDNITHHFDLATEIDLLTVGDQVIKSDYDRYQQLVEKRADKGLKTTLYSCTEHYPGNFLLSHPVESYWSIIHAGHYADGFLRWAYDAWVEDPLIDGTHNAFEPGDCFFIYPYNQPSLRLMMMHAALYDMYKLKTIEKQYPDKVAALLKRCSFKAEIKRAYLSKSDLASIQKEMAFFKQGLETLSRQYEREDQEIERLPLLNEAMVANTLPTIDLDERYISIVEKKPGTTRQYLGQPDTILTQSNRLITAYPKGHGKGEIIMQISDDEGETWIEYQDKPISWLQAQETPTLYTLNFKDGSEKLILISACPGWGEDAAGERFGFNTSISDDDGLTWSEFTHWYSQIDGKDNPAIVAMSSLIQLHDEQDHPQEAWLGVYHDYEYTNYKTILRFDEQGQATWSQPEPLIPQYRELEVQYKMCELGMIRNPEDQSIIAIARSQSHQDPSTIMFSYNEGESWTKPRYLPNSLAGERHKLVYNKFTNNVMISFREIIYDIDGRLPINGQTDWIAGDWVMWVGTFSDLLEGRQGEVRIRLKEDFTPSPKMGDTGYAGFVILNDGTCLLHSYGHWDEDFSSQWKKGV
ncbi:MAG TPA: glycoside hydrolase domain-containing protein, partial [Erysipelothrix sp.]